ncbi:Abi-alpha family protein [Hymenobacter lapidarius]|uniref:Abi-alpha family protein n=1 Tax=Hymenobacter lapidarius TaxID=1908237 RepID=UPI0009F26911|nr:Abi-alpha family protein [Hymenobacter lapidarius]
MAAEKQNSSLDLLGIKPISDAANTTVERSFQGIEGFLKSVCVPALDEVGLLLRDKVRNWRLNNILRILEKAKGKLHFENEELKIQAHPRVALAIIENGSLNDNDEVQEMWAGLFASSCTKSGQEDENLIFVNLLKQLTNAQARIMKYSSESARKIIYENGLIVGDKLTLDCKTLIEISGINEIHRLDRELDHLRSLDLLSGGFSAEDINLVAEISPTPLALNLYVKSQGHNSDPALFWQGSLITQAEKEKEDIEKQKADAEKQKVEAEARRQEMLAKLKT